MKKKGGKARKIQESCTYPIEIVDYEFSYSLSLGYKIDLLPDPILEHSDLVVTGKLLAPKKLADKMLTVKIFGSRKMLEALNNQDKISKDMDRIGHLEIRGNHAEFLCSVPIDMIQTLALSLQFKKTNYIVLIGAPLNYGKANITSIDFYREYEPHE